MYIQTTISYFSFCWYNGISFWDRLHKKIGHYEASSYDRPSDATKQLPMQYWLEEKEVNFLGKRLTGDKYLYHYCRTQRRCPGSFTKIIIFNVYLITFTSKRSARYITHERKLILPGFKTRLINVYFHVLLSVEITFDSDYLFCLLNYTVYRE